MKGENQMEKLVIRTSGFTLYLFGLIEIILVCFSLVLLQEVIISFDIQIVFSLIFLLFCIFYILNYILGNRVIITYSDLTIKIWSNGIFPSLNKLRSIEKNIKLDDVEFVFLGRLDYLKKLLAEKYKEDIDIQIKELKKIELLTEVISSSQKRNVGFKFIILMVILTKNGERILVSTKPYSKKHFTVLFNQFDKKNIEIVVEKGAL